MKATATKALEALLYQLLETELGGVKVYEKALGCAIDPDLKRDWHGALRETRRHVEIARGMLVTLGLDPLDDVPARLPLRKISVALVDAIELARQFATPSAAEATAAECVVEAETKIHMNWELVGVLRSDVHGELGALLGRAHAEVEEEEDRHLAHTMGWARELWLKNLGAKAVLPPPEHRATSARAHRDQCDEHGMRR